MAQPGKVSPSLAPPTLFMLPSTAAVFIAGRVLRASIRHPDANSPEVASGHPTDARKATARGFGRSDRSAQRPTDGLAVAQPIIWPS
jgi:hypothetical protein